jgi:hypothetical protein
LLLLLVIMGRLEKHGALNLVAYGLDFLFVIVDDETPNQGFSN